MITMGVAGPISLEMEGFLWEDRVMTTATVDDQRRVKLPNAKPGQVFAVEMDGAKVVLTPVQEAEPKARRQRLVRTEFGRLILSEPIPNDEIVAAIREDRDRDAK